MPRKLRKSVGGYLSKMKSVNSPLHHFSSTSFSSSKSWILKGCKHVKTLSFSGALDHHRRRRQLEHDDDQTTNNIINKEAATLADVDQFLYDNFRSLYIRDDEEEEDDRRPTKQPPEDFVIKKPPGGLLIDPPAKRAVIRPVGSSSSSGSLTDETADDVAGSSSTVSDTLLTRRHNRDNNDDVALPEDCIALLTYSRAPQEDFCRSMREMVASRCQDERGVDWEFMEELLFGYLNLNGKKSHKFILSAFVDLVIGLRPVPADVRAPARARRCPSKRSGALSFRTRGDPTLRSE